MDPANNTTATEPAKNDDGDQTEFERFEELARKIIAVPKAIIDKARQPKTA